MVHRPDNRRVAGALLIAAIVFAAPGSAQSRSARAGVYTDDQAKRGKAQYVKSCAACHLDDLSGGDRTPPLVGDMFLSNWADRTAGDLFDRIRTTMPQNDPGSLSREACLDILTYLLQANEYPAGQQALEDDAEALRHIAMK